MFLREYSTVYYCSIVGSLLLDLPKQAWSSAIAYRIYVAFCVNLLVDISYRIYTYRIYIYLGKF